MKKMKLIYIIGLLALLIIIIPIDCITANENITNDANLDDSMPINADLNMKFNQDNSSDNEVDVSVWIDVVNSNSDGKINSKGSEVPWTVTVTSSGGTARNIIVMEVLTDNMEYVSHNVSYGQYNPLTGIWNIGDLTNSNNVTLTVLTKLKTDGRFKFSANATTDSNDIDITNNYLILSIRSGSAKIDSNITETSDERNGAQHNSHYGSESKPFIERETNNNPQIETQTDIGQTNENNKRDLGNENSNSKSNTASNNRIVTSISKNINGNNILTMTTRTISSILNPTSIFEKINSNSKGHYGAVSPKDYTQIPILIFFAFIVILTGIIVYDKIAI